MGKIKILHFVSGLSISSGVMGVIMNYYRNINTDNIVFDFLYFNDSDKTYEKEIVDLGGNIFKIEAPSIKSINKYNDFFRKYANQYTAIHIHEVYLTFLIGPIAKENGIKNVITHSHNTKFSDSKIKAIRNRLLCLPVKRYSDYYFACSKAAGETLYGKKSLAEAKINVINNAISIDKFKFNKLIREEMRTQLDINDKNVIGHVGRFFKQKNHEFLLQIFCEVKKQDPTAILLLIGNGALEEKIKNKVVKLGIESSVIFMGARKDVANLLQVMDVFVLPSFYEGLPVIGVEAQTAGLPCILSDQITKEVGIINTKYLSLKEKPSIWAKQILDISNANIARADTIDKIRDAGFDIINEAKKLESMYLKMLNKYDIP